MTSRHPSAMSSAVNLSRAVKKRPWDAKYSGDVSLKAAKARSVARTFALSGLSAFSTMYGNALVTSAIGSKYSTARRNASEFWLRLRCPQNASQYLTKLLSQKIG